MPNTYFKLNLKIFTIYISISSTTILLFQILKNLKIDFLKVILGYNFKQTKFLKQKIQPNHFVFLLHETATLTINNRN